MSTDKHYYIEGNDEGKYTTTGKGAERASGTFDTQKDAIDYAKQLNPNDHPDVERVRDTSVGGRDKWRPAE